MHTHYFVSKPCICTFQWIECALLCFPCAGGFRNPECGQIMISVFKTRSSGFPVLKAMSGSSVDWVFSRCSFSNWHISLIGDRTGISQPTPGRIMTPLTITYMKAQARVHCISIEFINVIRTRECTYVHLNFFKKILIVYLLDITQSTELSWSTSLSVKLLFLDLCQCSKPWHEPIVWHFKGTLFTIYS